MLSFSLYCQLCYVKTFYWYNEKKLLFSLHKFSTLCRNLVGTHRIALKRIQKICWLLRTLKETHLHTWQQLQGTLKCLRYNIYCRVENCVQHEEEQNTMERNAYICLLTYQLALILHVQHKHSATLACDWLSLTF